MAGIKFNFKILKHIFIYVLYLLFVLPHSITLSVLPWYTVLGIVYFDARRGLMLMGLAVQFDLMETTIFTSCLTPVCV